MSTHVGVLGLGQIGMLCVERLVRRGCEVFVYDMSAERMDESRRAGAVPAGSAYDLGESAEIILVSLPAPDNVREALNGQHGLFGASKTSLVIDMSTVDPKTSREMASMATRAGIGYLDAPVSGGAPMMTGVDAAKAGTLTFMVGGDKGAYTEALPFLEMLGRKFHYVGESGSGSAVKLISNMLSGVHAVVAAEAFALGEAIGFDAATLMNVFQDTDAKSFFLTDYLWPRLESRNFEAGFSVDLQLKDHRLASGLGKATNTATPLNDAAIAKYDSVARAGFGHYDVAEIFRHA